MTSNITKTEKDPKDKVWKWTDEDLGYAYVRFCDEGKSAKVRRKVPANFIKYYVEGDKLNPAYKYKVFWSDGKDKSRDTPMKYLKKARNIPTFELSVADENYGKPGCYRAFVYRIEDSLEKLEQWITNPSNKVRDVSDKLAYSSFDAGHSSHREKSPQSFPSPSKEKVSSVKKKSMGTLKNVANVRRDMLADLATHEDKLDPISDSEDTQSDSSTNHCNSPDFKPSRNDKSKKPVSKGPKTPPSSGESESTASPGKSKPKASPKKFKPTTGKPKTTPMLVESDDDSDDLTITSPKKVRLMEDQILQQRQELKRSAEVKDKLRQQIKELCEKAGVPCDYPSFISGRPGTSSPEMPSKQASGAPQEQLPTQNLNASKSSDVTPKDETNGPKQTKRKRGISKKDQEKLERNQARALITNLVPIPDSFSGTEEFKVSEDFLFTKENITTLWAIGAGENNDQAFIKDAAVMLFGSRKLLQVGVVKGITVKGVKREGLNEVALESIRVLLILRARKEGVEVTWDTERTKQARVNRTITDKIKTLRISALVAEKTSAISEGPRSEGNNGVQDTQES